MKNSNYKIKIAKWDVQVEIKLTNKQQTKKLQSAYTFLHNVYSVFIDICQILPDKYMINQSIDINLNALNKKHKLVYGRPLTQQLRIKPNKLTAHEINQIHKLHSSYKQRREKMFIYWSEIISVYLLIIFNSINKRKKR